MFRLSLEERQKEMMELCKSESEEEDLPENENVPNETPKDNDKNNIETTETSTLTQDKVSSENDKLFDDLSEVNTETKNKDHIDSNVLKQNSTNIDLTDDDLNVDKATNNGSELVKDINDPNILHDNNSRKTLTDTNNEFRNHFSHEGNTSTEISLVYNDSIEEDQTDDADIEAKKLIDDNIEHLVISEDNVNNEVTGENSELKESDDSQKISLYYKDSEKQTCTEDLDIVSNIPSTSEIKQPEVMDEYVLSDDDVNMEDIDKLIENAEIMLGVYFVPSSTWHMTFMINELKLKMFIYILFCPAYIFRGLNCPFK